MRHRRFFASVLAAIALTLFAAGAGLVGRLGSSPQEPAMVAVTDPAR